MVHIKEAGEAPYIGLPYLPAPALPGSGSMGIISARISFRNAKKGTPLLSAKVSQNLFTTKD